MSNTWYLAWPKKVEPIEWDTYLAEHKRDASQFHGSRGPFPDEEMAEEARWRDFTEDFWEVGLAVYADHCLGCGWFAKVLAFDNEGGGWAWRVTECKRCGVIDQRVKEGLV